MTKKHPTSSRVHRDDDGLPDDAFVGSIKRLIEWGKSNQRGVTIGGIAVLVIAAAGYWFFTQQRQLEATAASRYTQVRQTLASGNVDLAIRDLQSFIDTFGSTDMGDQARLQLAELLIRQDRANEAVEALGDLPNRLDSPYGRAGARLEAAALESLDRLDEAAAIYTSLADNARFPYQERDALAGAARAHIQNGRTADAIPLLQRAVETFEEDETGRGYFEMWLAETRAQARSGQEATASASPTTSDAPVDSAAG